MCLMSVSCTQHISLRDDVRRGPLPGTTLGRDLALVGLGIDTTIVFQIIIIIILLVGEGSLGHK